MRSRWALALTAAFSIVIGGAVSASATDPVSLGNGRVLDDAGVLSAADERAIQQRSEELSQSSNVDLWVVFVDEFTDPSDAADWADQTAIDNGLGSNQYLLAVSTEGRTYHLSADLDGPVSEDALIAIAQQRVQPELRDEDWAGAAIAAADGLADATGGGNGLGGGQAGGGFGGILFRAHEWATREQTMRSYELFARYVMPMFQSSLEGPVGSLAWARENRKQVFGATPDAVRRAFTDFGAAVPEDFKQRTLGGRDVS